MKIITNNQTLALIKSAIYGFKINHNWDNGYTVIVPDYISKDAPIIKKLNQELNDYDEKEIKEKDYKKMMTYGDGRLTKNDLLLKLKYAQGYCGYIIGKITINGKTYR